MDSIGIPTCGSDGEKTLLSVLGLAPETRERGALLQQMKSEARLGCHRLCFDRENLLSHLQADASVEAPFAIQNITEKAVQFEIARIYDEAGKHTKPIYERGNTSNGDPADNWIIRWLLWHISETFQADDAGESQAQYELALL